MTMDFSQLHTYTPPQCAPENTGYTYSLSSSYSTAALEFEKEHRIAPVYESPRMSRRSLRLQGLAAHHHHHHANDAVLDYAQSQSQTQSTYETRKDLHVVSGRAARGRKLHSSSNTISLSLSQADTPRKNLSFSAVSTPIGSSTRLEESRVASSGAGPADLRHRTFTTTSTTTTTAVDGIWGRMSHSGLSSSNGGDPGASTSHAAHVNGYICQDCDFHSSKENSSAKASTSSSSLQQPAVRADPFAYRSSFHTRTYSRDGGRKSPAGVVSSASSTCVRLGRKVLAPFVFIFTALYGGVLWLRASTRGGAQSAGSSGVLASCKDSLRQTASSSLSQVWFLKHKMMGDSQVRAHSSYCGSMNVKDLGTEDASHLNLNGSLCDDCKGKQYSETRDVVCARSPRSRGATRSLLLSAGHVLLMPVRHAARAVGALGWAAALATRKLLALLWALVTAPVTAGRGLLWLVASGWYHLASLVSLLNVFFLTRCLPQLWKLLLLLPLLLVWWLWASSDGGGGGAAAVLPRYSQALKLGEWPSFVVAYLSKWFPASSSSSPTGTSVPLSQTPPPPPPLGADVEGLERLERLERRLALLWEQVHRGDQRQELRRRDILARYAHLSETLRTETDKEALGAWAAALLEGRLGELRGPPAGTTSSRPPPSSARPRPFDPAVPQSDEELKVLQGSHATRLDGLESQLGALLAKTQEVAQKQKQEPQQEPDREAAVALAALRAEREREELAQVRRLESDLAAIREDLRAVAACRGRCEQLGQLRETVSAQIREELRAEFYSRETGGMASEGLASESLAAWLAKRYVSTADMRASLDAVEQRVLSDLTLRAGAAQSVSSLPPSSLSVEGLSEEQVKVIVQNALKLYSQDKTGLADYALESGGGSILSTRCSETHETKTALVSLFGLPLWYFSQSPRVVIQPDMYPGNCWAFKSSQGYLVIRLSAIIRPTAFSLEHIPKALSPSGNISSAPQNFTVFGLDDEYQEEGELLGRYTYREDGESLQTFPVQEATEKSFQMVELRVLSNWGHPDYTCLYRFRVHGEPRPPQ
ncbi:LOW QUALITY PROTEIN: SUN domain-containing protein 1-like [Stigmatopora argus]